MIIPFEVYADVLDHCIADAGRNREACGILAGRIDTPNAVFERYPLTNVHDRPHARFAFDPDEQIRLWTLLDGSAMRPWIIYHSHLDTPSVMSPDDITFGTGDLSMLHLVVSMNERNAHLWEVARLSPDALMAVGAPMKIVDTQGNPRSPRW